MTGAVAIIMFLATEGVGGFFVDIALHATIVYAYVIAELP